MIETSNTQLKKILQNNLFIELTDYQIISISGPDAAKFLQGQLTCDVREITTTRSSFGAFCNHKGRVLAVFRIFYSNEKYYLLLPAAITDSTLKTLKKFAVFSKVTLALESNWIALGCSGSKIESLLLKHFSLLPQKINDTLAANNITIIRIHGTESRYQIFAAPQFLPEIIHQADSFTHELANKIWQLQDIAAGIPKVLPETLEMFTPHMLNLDQLGAISLQKGCYVGQEIIARTQYLGKSKRRLIKIAVATAENILPGAKILNEQQQEIGQVVNGVNVNEYYYGLAVLSEDLEKKDDFLPMLLEKETIMLSAK